MLLAEEAPNIDLVHGDIRLTPEQRAELSTETSNKLKAVMRSTFAMWPNAIVPYVLDGSLGKFYSIIYGSTIYNYPKFAVLCHAHFFLQLQDQVKEALFIEQLRSTMQNPVFALCLGPTSVTMFCSLRTVGNQINVSCMNNYTVYI